MRRRRRHHFAALRRHDARMRSGQIVHTHRGRRHRRHRIDLVLRLGPPVLACRQATGFDVTLQPMAGPGARQRSLHVLLQVVLLALADQTVEHDQEDADAECKQAGAHQFVPPSAFRFKSGRATDV